MRIPKTNMYYNIFFHHLNYLISNNPSQFKHVEIEIKTFEIRLLKIFIKYPEIWFACNILRIFLFRKENLNVNSEHMEGMAKTRTFHSSGI